MLGRFLDQQSIPRLQTHWLHEIFRGLGRPLGLGHMVRVILTAEVVATVYYRALLAATRSELLRQICRRILLDEELHLAFHCVAIRRHAAGRSRLSTWLWRQLYRGLMAGSALVVYAASYRTFRAGGYGLGRYCRTIVLEYARVERMQAPGADLTLRGHAAPATVAAPQLASDRPARRCPFSLASHPAPGNSFFAHKL